MSERLGVLSERREFEALSKRLPKGYSSEADWRIDGERLKKWRDRSEDLYRMQMCTIFWRIEDMQEFESLVKSDATLETLREWANERHYPIPDKATFDYFFKDDRR